MNHGYLRGRGGRVVKLPDSVAGAVFVDVLGINNFGIVVGQAFDAAGTGHGFFQLAGLSRLFDFPGAWSTNLEGINDLGTAVGYRSDASGLIHGFLLRRGTTA